MKEKNTTQGPDGWIHRYDPSEHGGLIFSNTDALVTCAVYKICRILLRDYR